jgi:hypothetical protein
MRSLLVASPLLLAACAIVPVKPPDDRLSLLSPADRSSLLVGEDYVRLAMYLPGTRTGGAMVIASQQVNGKTRYTFAGPVEAYQDGALDWDAVRPLQEARARSPYHQPVQTELEGKRFWFVPDRVPKLEPDKEPELAQTLEMYDADPRDARPSLLQPVGVFHLSFEQRGFLGVESAPVTKSDITARGLPAATRGAIVRAVSPGGPADRAGILPGDVILAIDGIAITSPEDLSKVVSKLPAGSEVTVSRLRGGERREVRGSLGIRGSSTAIIHHGQSLLRLQDAWFAPGFVLQAATLAPWRPGIDEILQGKSSRSIWGDEDARTESAFNDTLVEWKNRGMPGWLRGATAEQLAQAILTTEKGVLALDVSIRILKDKIDAAARDGKEGTPGAGEAEQLLEQRKMLLGVLLGAMKSAASQASP